MSKPLKRVDYIIVHHSESPMRSTTRDKIDEWHKEKYGGIAYHKVIEADGQIKDGRPENIRGAHTAGLNYCSLGVCVVGNFDWHPKYRQEYPNLAQLESLVYVLTDWCKRYHLNPDDIYGHREAPGYKKYKTCPGKNLLAFFPQIKAKIKRNLDPYVQRVLKSVRDLSVHKALEDALLYDREISYEEAQDIILSTIDYQNITRTEIEDLKQILKHARIKDQRTKRLISEFIHNPYYVMYHRI